MFKRMIRETALRIPGLATMYSGSRSFYHRTRKILFYVRDAKLTFKHMNWMGAHQRAYTTLSAALLFQYHKLEKGLCMPGEKRFFGYDPAIATLDLMAEWRKHGLSEQDPVFRGAIETLRAYRQRLNETPPKQGKILRERLDGLLEQYTEQEKTLSTPLPARLITTDVVWPIFQQLVEARRSVREYQSTPVDLALIRRAAELAQLSPSACNRQPCRIHVYSDKQKIEALLALQNGNRGFGHTAPLLILVTADAYSFFDASERNQPYVDGGLYAMNLLYALQAQGLSSCCLNWCVEPAQDELAHQLGKVPEQERIVMYLLVGYAASGALVPRSPRRALESTVIIH
ncbi:nitroreductase family protein [Chitinibacter sp. ZOR0017]|uniref:nitroreductase family protein n=1 Tax=Chitinibacter sp. ZOR0017 TaxID=1339254 RepID=UPI0006900E80|nr:nitroreductase family protein [Chitinibacter sp. ZOR0017]